MERGDEAQLYRNFKHLYEGLMRGDIDKVLRQYEKLPACPPKQLTVLGDTLLHIAIYMGHENIAREILNRQPQHDLCTLIRAQNAVGDTILHEVAATNMVGLARYLLEKAQDLLYTANELGETPLFRAAHNGQRQMFDLLALAVHMTDRDNLQRHLIRKDRTNILHMVILAEFFDLAFVIAKKYPFLVIERDGFGKIGLQLLSSNPLAFMSGRNYGLLKRLIFRYCAPSTYENTRKKEGYQGEDQIDSYEIDSLDDEDEDPDNRKPKDCKMPQAFTVCMSIFASVLTKLNISIWTFLRAWPTIERMYKEHGKHESAFRLAKLLIKQDTTWEINLSKEDRGKISLGVSNLPKGEDDEEEGKNIARQGKNKKGKEQRLRTKSTTLPPRRFSSLLPSTDFPPGMDDKSFPNPNTEVSESSEIERETNEQTIPPVLRDLPAPPTSLLTATSHGIVEIVKEILRVFPQAVEHVSDAGQNILHIAIKHRKLEIFRHVKKMQLPMTRLVRRIDNNGYTILHHVGVMRYYTGGTLPGPTLQLQEELRWFERVRKIVPPHYEMHRNNKGETAQEFFRRTHSKLLKEAQDWLKRTSESCSAVAVLIATVAFAAAYTVPGGSNQDTGVPILLHDPFFLVFTVMDVLSLASSLTSVVMFLSILTSPFQLQDFHYSLPRKLTLGFTFLFFSVAVTMLAFAATIVLIIHLKKRWITTLIYGLAFLLVTVFALLQFPLYLAFMDTMKYSWKMVKHSLPALPCSTNVSTFYKSE
ncbi:uncharacterized protein LOC125422093 [Ziziphus jujuba]|uniref:Uncharacterized protein LOC125422093 n=1 Tax=Ziziphus jujuba TaxID=326968 RepID=A0ABM3IHE1_ZIZJJ|nr:uncharacterized protein LOC125422093 [Ziziphus jujuba]